MKILLSAYCCSPDSGSEQGFGWWWVTKCAEKHQVTVITCEAQKNNIEAYLKKKKLGSIKFIYVKGPKRVSPSGTVYRFERVHQYFWQIRAIKVVRQLSDQEKFDIAQHVTIGTWRQCSCLAFSSIPFIFGPISGSEKLPAGFILKLGIKGAIWEKIREILIFLARFDPLVRYTLKRADVLLTAGPATYNLMKSKFPGKTFPFTRAIPNPALKCINFKINKNLKNNSKFKISWMGRLIPRKGLELLLNALADQRLSNCNLSVIGDGPYKDRYIKLASKLGIEDLVTFLGHLNQKKAFEIISSNNIFIFTSLQDMMGQSLSEAMQIGMPCIVMDWSGPAWLVGENGAYKVPVSHFKQTYKDLANAIFKVKTEIDIQKGLANSSRERIEYLINPINFERKINSIFDKAVRGS
jgi:glycosyltransferase involved in cell wall biosynthesis